MKKLCDLCKGKGYFSHPKHPAKTRCSCCSGTGYVGAGKLKV